MKRTLSLLVVLILLITLTKTTFSQCTPDPSITDTSAHLTGRLVPDTLVFIVGQTATQTITFAAPTNGEVTPGNYIPLGQTHIKELIQMPTWCAKSCDPSDCKFPAGSVHCILASATNAQADSTFYHIYGKLDVYAPGNMIRLKQDYIYPTPIVIWVKPDAVSVTEFSSKDFTTYSPRPNPFTSTTKIDFFTSKQQKVTFNVYDMLGKIIYTETMNSNIGTNSFNFNGYDLSKGVYLYSISNSDNVVITKKLIKTE